MIVCASTSVPWLVVNHLHLLSDGWYDAVMSVKLTLKWVKVNDEFEFSHDWALLKTPDDHKQNRWRRKSQIVSHRDSDQCLL